MEVVVREELAAVHTGDPEGLAEALGDLDDVLAGEADLVGLNDPRREDAWRTQAGG